MHYSTFPRGAFKKKNCNDAMQVMEGLRSLREEVVFEPFLIVLYCFVNGFIGQWWEANKPRVGFVGPNAHESRVF